MALILLSLGLLLIVTGYEGTFSLLIEQLGQDMPGFAPWAAAFVLAGLLGYIPDFAGVSDALLVLFVVALLIGHAGVWQQLQQLVTSPPAPAAAPAVVSQGDQTALAAGPTLHISLGGSGGGGGGSSNPAAAAPGLFGRVLGIFGLGGG